VLPHVARGMLDINIEAMIYVIPVVTTLCELPEILDSCG
jgi:hypothetical protein